MNLGNGLKQTREKFKPTLTGELKNSYLNRFHILSSFLRKKPYAFSLSANKSRELENREFFERQIVNSTIYAGNFGFKNKFIPVSFSFNSNSKTIDRPLRPSHDFQDKELSLNLSNESKITGKTYFEFTQDKFSRTESDTPEQRGTTEDFSLFNQKYLFGDDRKLLNSDLHLYELSGASDSSILSLNENLNIEHAGYLTSSYNYNFSDKSSSGVNARANKVSANLKHRLYRSLTSSFGTYYFKNDATSFSENSFGLSLDEDYVKELGKIGRLNSGIGLAYSQEEKKAPGSVVSIIDESHTLTTGTITLLDKPRVDTATVMVTDSTGTTTYTLNVDYQLSSAGERTQIQRIPGGSISGGQVVLVDYEAKSSPSFKFNTLGENFRFRIDFLDNLIGVFYRSTRERHPRVSGEENTILQTITDTLAGLDFNYKNWKVELEDENYDSNLAPYKQVKLKESFFFNPSEKSTLTFQSSQSRIMLVNTQNTQKFFDFISRYSAGLNRYTRFNLEAGFRWQEGLGVDLNDVTAGSSLELNLNKFLMDVKYDFKKQSYLGDRLVNHFFYTRIRRRF